jgi:hypothetical protein
MFLNPAQIFPSSDDNFSFAPSLKVSPENPNSFWNRGNRILPLDEILRESQQDHFKGNPEDFEMTNASLDNFFEELSKATTPAQEGPYPFLESDFLNFELPIDPMFPKRSLESKSGVNFSGMNSRNSIDPSVLNFSTEADDGKQGKDDEDDDDDDDDFFSCDSPISHTSNKSSGRSKNKFYSRSGQVADPNRGPCHNCHTKLTCYWRKLKGQYHCNACTLYYKRNHCHRSVEEVNKPIKRRNRKSKYDI